MIRTIRRPAGRPAVRSRMPLQREIISAGASYLVYPSPSRSFPPLLVLLSFSFLRRRREFAVPVTHFFASYASLRGTFLPLSFLPLFSPVSFLLLLTRLYQFRTRLDNVRAKYVRALPPATTTIVEPLLRRALPYLSARRSLAARLPLNATVRSSARRAEASLN